MAAAEAQNIYDVFGTVLYRTVPVNVAADAPVPRDLDDAQNIPLDYDTALRLLEAEHTAQLGGGAEGGATSTAAANSGGLSGRGNARSAGRMSVSAVDARLPAATAASSLNASMTFAAPSPPQRSGLANASTRTGLHSATLRVVGTASAKNGGAAAAPPGAATRRMSRVVGFDDGLSLSPEGIAARNAHVAKAAFARGAATATTTAAAAAAVSQQGARNAAQGQSAAAAAAAGGGGGRVPGGRPLTVADAMATLFPISPVPGSEVGGDVDGADAAVADTNGTRRSRKASLSSAALGSTTATATAAARSRRTSGTPASFPRLWQRADVGHTSRLDVVMLYLHLQRRAATEYTRPRGVVCPNRERLYGDVLQELTRQVTLLCPERGLLLEELDRSMKQATETYDVLLDSASQYAVRKSTERDLHQHLFVEKADLETEVRRREHRVSEWRAKYAGLQKRFEEQQAADEKLHEQEIAYARRANTQLVSEIKRLASEAEKSKEA